MNEFGYSNFDRNTLANYNPGAEKFALPIPIQKGFKSFAQFQVELGQFVEYKDNNNNSN